MKLRNLSVALLLLVATSVRAGLYSCSKSNGRPVRVQEEGNRLSFSTSSVILPAVASNSFKNIQNKSPFLVYYAIDSTEAFMQYSTRFEIASLIKSCRQNSNVNFAGFINSLYVEKNQIIVCKNKVATFLDLKNLPALDKRLKAKRKFISKGDHTSEDPDDVMYRSPYSEESNKPFSRYPLAHPEFLFELVNLVTTDARFFPSKNFTPFLNLKSHGGKYNVLAGMHRCQEKAKELAANEMLNNILTKQEINFLKQQDTYDKIEKNIDQYSNILDKIGLGYLYGNMSSDRGMSSERGMGIVSSGLGDAIAGLGVDQGLGAELSFGSNHPNLNWVLADLFPNDSEKTLGFLMLESCDTNRDPDLFHSYLNNVYAYYSAKHSLWYRNLNWWEMLEQAQGSSSQLIEILKIETAKIPNFEVIKAQ